MKNIFYFDSSYDMTLLLNEECENNCIFFIIDTDETANQYLDIVCNTQNTSQLLESDKRNVIELTGERWATGGCTTFRLRNDDTATAWYGIDFPETMSTDMCLCETSDYNFAAQCQKSEFDTEAIKSNTYIYTNTREYYVRQNLIKILVMQFTVLEKTNANFIVTILLKTVDIEETANFKLLIQINKIDLEVFAPIQKLDNGDHIITFSYPISDCVAYNANTVIVYASIDDGYAFIGQEKLRAGITAVGLVTDNVPWDGLIDIEETIKPISLTDNLIVKTLTDSAEISTQTPTSNAITQIFTGLQLKPLILRGFEETISSGEIQFIVAQQTVTFAGTEYTETVGGVTKLKTEYVFESAAEEIDTGYMSAVEIVTDVFQSVESVVISNG